MTQPNFGLVERNSVKAWSGLTRTIETGFLPIFRSAPRKRVAHSAVLLYTLGCEPAQELVVTDPEIPFTFGTRIVSHSDGKMLRCMAGELLHDKTKTIHVMDREGDQFELMSMLLEHSQRFVIRLAHNRRLEPGRGKTDNPKLFESLANTPFLFEREVDISTRGKPLYSNKLDVFPARKNRIARLEVRAAKREIFAVHSAAAHVPSSLSLQIVEVREVNAPKGEESIIWRLLSTEPVETQEQVAAIVDIYRKRWLIEEFFKALKTGCRFQQLQLESIHALLIALSIETAVAWRLLLLRWAAQYRPQADATTVLSAEQLRLLVALTRSETGRRLKKNTECAYCLI